MISRKKKVVSKVPVSEDRIPDTAGSGKIAWLQLCWLIRVNESVIAHRVLTETMTIAQKQPRICHKLHGLYIVQS